MASNPAGDSAPAADGVWLNALTSSATNNAWKSSSEAVTDSGTTTNRLPCSNAPHISPTDQSKASE
ncbi:hypothetical protein A5643_12610 [Mycobacterium sp. 1274756.6]|nr:hypothetical protein A5643_12610 [Mycobacterium sp. 1274756.6]